MISTLGHAWRKPFFIVRVCGLYSSEDCHFLSVWCRKIWFKSVPMKLHVLLELLVICTHQQLGILQLLIDQDVPVSLFPSHVGVSHSTCTRVVTLHLACTTTEWYFDPFIHIHAAIDVFGFSFQASACIHIHIFLFMLFLHVYNCYTYMYVGDEQRLRISPTVVAPRPPPRRTPSHRSVQRECTFAG